MTTKRNSKKVRAFLYVIVGTLLAFASASFAIYMWFSGTFLANMWWSRKALYVVLITAFVLGFFMMYEGIKYLFKRKRRR